MGYIVLPKQHEAINIILSKLDDYDSMELLWLPGVIQVTIWTKLGHPTQYRVDEDGQIDG